MNYLSKSAFCKGYQCTKSLWMEHHMPDKGVSKMDQSRIDTGVAVGLVAKEYFGNCVTVEFQEDYKKLLEQTKKYMQKQKINIAEATFMIQELFCRVDILRKDGDKIDIIEVKSGTAVEPIHKLDVAYQYYVLEKCGMKIQNAYVMYIDHTYVRNGELDIKQLFALEDVTRDVLALQNEIEDTILKIKTILETTEEPNMDIGIYCDKPYECAYKEYCSRHIPENSVFEIRGMTAKKKYELYHQGIITFADIIENTPKISAKQMKQVEAVYYNQPPIVEKGEIQAFLDTLQYPLYCLDFETFQQAIPLYDGIKPYMQIPFQYSLHIVDGGNLTHYEFLGKEGTDPRRALAERLCKDIPKGVCSLAYNMSFEKGVIQNLARIYPDLSEHLMDIYENMKDLQIPFQKQHYYSQDLRGSYSIKWVLPAICGADSELDYHGLEDIHNGSEAMVAFAQLHTLSKEEVQKTRKNLLAYCRLDTLAMVKILEKTKEMNSY